MDLGWRFADLGDNDDTVLASKSVTPLQNIPSTNKPNKKIPRNRIFLQSRGISHTFILAFFRHIMRFFNHVDIIDISVIDCRMDIDIFAFTY